MDNRFEVFTVLVNRISRSIRRIKNQEMAACGLRSAYVSCLYHLTMEDGLTATDLGERCEEDKATISRALTHLEREGYITCPDPGTKRYRSPLLLTEKGRAAGQVIAGKINHVLEEISAEMTEEERLTFYRCLSRISDHLGDIAAASERGDAL